MRILKGPTEERFARIWVADLADVESGALDQLRLMLALPDLAAPVAVMPDVHRGQGAVIGSIVPLRRTVVSNITGVDIGCGVRAVETNLVLSEAMDRSFWRTWKSKVDRAIPMGFGRHAVPQEMPEELRSPLQAFGDDEDTLRKLQRELVPLQLGTLGSGNHYLEAAVDERGVIWLHVHSGSRHTGLRIAEHYARLARERAFTPGVPKDLEGLPIDSDEGRGYLADMAWALSFARASRARMADMLLRAFAETVRALVDDLPVTAISELDIHHNFAEVLTDGTVIHRKGATQAKAGQLGIIPGSMGSYTCVVRGLGNPLSYESCSHGAGRRLSRSQAKRTISEADHARSLVGTFTSPSTKLLDESPLAYKPIAFVLANQADLVEIVHTLRPLISLKGGAGDD